MTNDEKVNKNIKVIKEIDVEFCRKLFVDMVRVRIYNNKKRKEGKNG